MRSNTAVFPSTLLFLLAHQNLVTATPTTIFFTMTSRKMKDDSNIITFHNEELPSERKKSILVELMSNDVLSYDVPEKEANMYWHDFARSIDNMDVINSVRNRNNKQHHNTPSFSTTENFAGLRDDGSTLLFFPLQLCIPVDSNNNIDFNITSFCLSSSLVHQHGPTEMAPLLTVMPSMTHKVKFAVVAYNTYEESRITSLTSINEERPLHQDSVYAAEATSPPAPISHILPLRIDDTAPIDVAAHHITFRFALSILGYTFALDYSPGLFTSTDILTCNIHYCQLHDVCVFNNDGGEFWTMSLRLDNGEGIHNDNGEGICYGKIDDGNDYVSDDIATKTGDVGGSHAIHAAVNWGAKVMSSLYEYSSTDGTKISSCNFITAGGSYWFEEQFYNSNSQTSRIFNTYWARFIACNIFRCHQAFELGAIFFDIEAWGECLCCLFREDRRSHYMSANGLFRASQKYCNWIFDRKLHAITYAHLVGTTRDATVLRDVDLEDICLKGNMLERISADRSSLYDVWAVIYNVLFDVVLDGCFDTTTPATCHGIGDIHDKRIGYPTSLWKCDLGDFTNFVDYFFVTREYEKLTCSVFDSHRLHHAVALCVSVSFTSANIGSTQCASAIGHSGVPVHITVSSFLVQPICGHLDLIKRLYAYVIKMEHVLIRYRTDMPDITDCTTVDWGTEVKPSVKVCEHNEAWNAQALSIVTAASAVMICASSPCTIILPRRLLRLSIQLHLLDVLLSGRNDDLLDNGTSYQFPTLCFGMHGSADRIKISSCTPSTEYGEHLLWEVTCSLT